MLERKDKALSGQMGRIEYALEGINTEFKWQKILKNLTKFQYPFCCFCLLYNILIINKGDQNMIHFITTKTRPQVGTTAKGLKLKECHRHAGFVITEKELTLRVNHVVDSRHVKAGFYVIGSEVK
jgi:hypothetical protein